MQIRSYDQQAPITTKDGSTIRSLLDRANAPVANQSLAAAMWPTDAETQRHYHRLSEESWLNWRAYSAFLLATAPPYDCRFHTIEARAPASAHVLVPRFYPAYTPRSKLFGSADLH